METQAKTEKQLAFRRLQFAVICFLFAAYAQCALADGEIDTSFGDNGFVVLNSLFDHSPPLLSQARAVALDADGRIVIVGAAQRLDKYGNTADANFLLLRLSATGGLDNTFALDAGGYRLVNFDLTGIGAPGNDAATSVVIEPNGYIVAGGGAYFDITDKHFAFVRVDDTGEMDQTFGNGGMLHFGAFYSPINDLSDFAVDPSGNLLLGGSIYFGPKEYAAVAKLTSAGQIDADFDYGYVSIFSYGVPPATGQNDYLMALGLDGSGGIVTAGGFYSADIQGAAVQRVTPSGKLDPAFGSGAPVEIASDPNAYLTASAIHVLPNGDFVVAGISSGYPNYLYFAKFLADGTPDNSFGANGVAKLVFETNGTPILLAPTKRGGWLMAGSYSQQGVFLAKALANGEPDTTLGGTGFIGLVFPPDVNAAFGLFSMAKPALTQDGRLVVAGSLPEAEANGSGDIGVIRIMADYDTLFVGGFE